MKIKIYNSKTIGLWLDAKSLEIRKRKEKKRKGEKRKENFGYQERRKKEIARN